MLDSACIRRPGLVDGRLDVGRILETMLYYDRVNLFVDLPIFSGLWKEFGFSGTRDLLSHPSIIPTITPEFSAVKNSSNGSIRIHTPIFGRYSGRDGKRIRDSDYASSLFGMIARQPQYSSKRQVEIILKITKRMEYKEFLGSDFSRNDIFHSIISDAESFQIFVEQYARKNNLAVNSERLATLKTETLRIGGGFVLNSNLQPSDVIVSPPPEGTTAHNWEGVLAAIHDYAIDLQLTGKLSVDLVCSEEVGEVADRRIDLGIRRGLRSSEAISVFERATIGRAHAFSDAVNSGQLSLSDALRVVDRTRKFREWLTKLPPAADLLASYHQEIAKDPVLEKLPVKVARFSLFTGVGLAIDALSGGSGVGTLIGTGLSACDAFLVDRITSGWRPSSFVKTVVKAME